MSWTRVYINEENAIATFCKYGSKYSYLIYSLLSFRLCYLSWRC